MLCASFCRGLTADQRMGRVAIDDPSRRHRSGARLPAPHRRAAGEHARNGLLLAVAEGRGTCCACYELLATASLDVGVFEPAERDELISIGDGAVHFRHPLVRSVVYQTASPAERRAPTPCSRVPSTMRTVAPGISPRQLPSRLPLPPRRWSASPSVRLGSGADSTAAHALARAAELTSQPDEQGRLFAKAARAANRGGDAALATQLLAQAAPLVGEDPIGRADLTVLDADLRMRRGDLHGAYLDLTKQAEAIAPIDVRRATVMLLMAANLHVYRMEAADGLASVRRAIELSGSDSLDLLQISSLGMTQTMAGDPEALATARAAASAV